MNQSETIAAIESADISREGWHQRIFDEIQCDFAQLFLQVRAVELGYYLASDEEKFRQELLLSCRRDIWNK